MSLKLIASSAPGKIDSGFLRHYNLSDTAAASAIAEKMTDNLSERQRLLLARLKSGQARNTPVPRTIARMEGDGLRPLSRAQKRLVFEEELYPGNVFNGSLTIEYSGALDVDCLQKALDILMERHEILRSNAEFAGDEPKLRIHRPSRVPMDIFRIGAEPEDIHGRRVQGVS